MSRDAMLTIYLAQPKAGAGPAEEDQNDKRIFKYFECKIFGVAALAVNGRTSPLVLDLEIGVAKGSLNFRMSPVGTDKTWTSVFGVNNFDVCRQPNLIGWLRSLHCAAYRCYIFGVLPSKGQQRKQGQGGIRQRKGDISQQVQGL